MWYFYFFLLLICNMRMLLDDTWVYVNEWVVVIWTQMRNLSAIPWWEQVTFDEMMSTLYYTNTLSWIFIVLAHWNNSLCVDMSFHSDKLPWFRTNQSLLFLLNAACLAEMQQISNINFIVFSLTYHTQGKNANHYTTNMVFNTRILLYDLDTLVYVWFVLLSTIFQLLWIHFYLLNTNTCRFLIV